VNIPINEILVGDALERLRELPDESVHCCVTSPPYWGLRRYLDAGHPDEAKQIGLEASVGEYVDRLVQVFREVRRVLRSDGTCWINLGDSYVDGGRGQDLKSTLEGTRYNQAECRQVRVRESAKTGLRPKNLMGMPWRVAFALQEDGWILRMDVIWAKKNVMPESVRDRPTKAHEYIFQFAKDERYFYDHWAIAEPQEEQERTRRLLDQTAGARATYNLHRDREHGAPPGDAPPGASGAVRSAAARQALALKGTRNARSVWWMPTEQFTSDYCRACRRYFDRRPEACPCGAKDRWLTHFATFPQELVERCILAGTSERGCCGTCGAPFVRIVQPSSAYAKLLKENEGRNHSGELDETLSGRYGSAMQEHPRVAADYESRGFEASCPHGPRRVNGKARDGLGDRTAGLAGQAWQDWKDANPSIDKGFDRACANKDSPPPTPAVVLDPFMGAGTTALVGLKAGRHFIGIEINGEYADMAMKRIAPELQQGRLV
jgi:DNA modification methylase